MDLACVDPGSWLSAAAGGLGLLGLVLGTVFGFIVHGWESWD